MRKIVYLSRGNVAVHQFPRAQDDEEKKIPLPEYEDLETGNEEAVSPWGCILVLFVPLLILTILSTHC
jgi:hypothetical protein